jgi:hypothetical protein
VVAQAAEERVEQAVARGEAALPVLAEERVEQAVAPGLRAAAVEAVAAESDSPPRGLPT